MSKRMLINASHEEESRVAIVDGDYLQELDIESAQKVQTKSNIYKGTITKIEPSLQAAFVEYGSARQGFLPLNEIHPEYWKDGVDKTLDHRNVSIQDVLEHKQPILIQVVKEERGTKGAALTTYISLAGRYLVLSPNTERGGISRKLDEEDRQAMKQILAQLNVPENMGLILRTAGKDQTLEALQRDSAYLCRLWDEIRIKSQNAPLPSLIYLEGDLATRAIRDHFTDDVTEIWVDNYDLYERTKQFVHAVLPGKEKLVKLYRGKKPLFRHYGIEDQCEEIHEREIRLPSGGSIVFDPTEALTSIDVNSSRSTGGKHIDDTAVATNLEAAAEVARQLRIRDIGGLIVIDFIDMASRKHAQQVEETLRDACKADKARIQMARISRFGLLEMSRQRLHPSVRESTTEMCPRCQGRGSVLTTESMALHMLTRIENMAEAGKKPTLVVQVPSDAGEYLMNNKRDDVARIEALYEIQVTLQIRQELEIPHYRIERHWTDNNQQKIEVLEDTTKGKKPPRPGRKLKPLEPIVGVPKAPDEPVEDKPKKVSLLASLFGKLLGSKPEAPAEPEPEKKAEPAAGSGQAARRGRRGGRNRRGGRKPQQADGDAQPGQEQAERPQRPRRERPERPERPDAAMADGEKSENGGEGEGEAQKRRRPRRRRRRPSNRTGELGAAPETTGGETRAPESPPAVPAGE
jgi:ribonuclease E